MDYISYITLYAHLTQSSTPHPHSVMLFQIIVLIWAPFIMKNYSISPAQVATLNCGYMHHIIFHDILFLYIFSLFILFLLVHFHINFAIGLTFML